MQGRLVTYRINKALKQKDWKYQLLDGLVTYRINKALKLMLNEVPYLLCLVTYRINKALKPNSILLILE